MNDQQCVLRADNVCKTYDNGTDRLDVIRNVSLEVQTNEVVAVTGESGCGKSTLLNVISGLDSPDSGTVEIMGKRVSNMGGEELSAFRGSTIGFVFQLHHLLKDFTALENVVIPAMMHGERRSSALERAEFLLTQVGLQERLKHYPYQLSGGERQRVAVARALINNPAIVLADEPTGNLDEKSSRTVEELLFSVVNEAGNALLIVTHDPGIASNAATRYTLRNGTLGPSS